MNIFKTNYKSRKLIFLFLYIIISINSYSQTVKILFDATKAEMAGNADWVIDADANDLGINTNGKMIIGIGDEANPQGIPTPNQSGITTSTSETYWTGALSSWAVDCAKQNYKVESLPFNDSITYGNTIHTKDLMHYNIFVVCEPNILFTASEKNAIVKFVKDGGRLFIIADHDMSDRNGDGYDSPTIWNNLFSTNTIQTNPFGVTFDLQNYDELTTNVANLPNDSCLHGSFGNVTKMELFGATTLTIDNSANITTKGLVYRGGVSNTGTTGIYFARAYFGLGKVCILTDSSPPDDGTGDANDVLYNGYTGDASGQHQWLLMNATIWLAHNSFVLSNSQVDQQIAFKIYPNPSNGSVHIESNNDLPNELEIFDLIGRNVYQTKFFQHIEIPNLNVGNWVFRIKNDKQYFTKLIVVQ